MNLRFWARWRWVRLTRDGWWFATVVACIALVALNTGNNLLYLLLAMLLSLVIASLIMAEVSLRGVVPRRQPPPRVHARDPFLMGIVLRNEKRRFPSFSIEVEDLCDDQVVDKRCYFLKIPSGRTQQTSYRHSLPQRGRSKAVAPLVTIPGFLPTAGGDSPVYITKFYRAFSGRSLPHRPHAGRVGATPTPRAHERAGRVCQSAGRLLCRGRQHAALVGHLACPRPRPPAARSS